MVGAPPRRAPSPRCTADLVHHRCVAQVRRLRSAIEPPRAGMLDNLRQKFTFSSSLDKRWLAYHVAKAYITAQLEVKHCMGHYKTDLASSASEKTLSAAEAKLRHRHASSLTTRVAN